ncbi:MAG: hypothetical protein LC749_11500 [Actinobacteria bacterium]|nr:hypothetical protein [Actinomycetota bacterium]
MGADLTPPEPDRPELADREARREISEDVNGVASAEVTADRASAHPRVLDELLPVADASVPG